MSMNKVKLSQIIRDYMITLDHDDYVSNASDIAIRNLALRGIREIGFDIGKKIRSIKLDVESNDTITLPDDYVDVSKIGIIGSDGIIRALTHNGNLNYSRKYTAKLITNESNQGPLNIDGNLILDREDDKTSTTSSSADDLNAYVFENYRIEIASNDSFSQVVIEYVADEARSTDPEVHVYAEEALRCYIYYKLCERKSSVPANEKARARTEYYNERRKANARLSHFTKNEALKTIRKNFMQAPKF